jgi:Ca-activated chloride channel family protein
MKTVAETIAAKPVKTRKRARILRQPPSPLSGVQFNLHINELLSTLCIEQTFRNNEDRPIEVSYLWALPPATQMLDVEVQLGAELLRGTIEAQAQAEQRYEQALRRGQTAFCLRIVEDQLLHIALGNLLPGEALRLRLQLGWWLHPDQGRVRLTIPTTLAPRYGRSHLQPHEQTHSNLLIEYPAALQASIHGALVHSEIACPSHPLAVRHDASDVLSLSIRNARLDRDIVIDLRQPADRANRISGCRIQDGPDQYLAMLVFGSAPSKPRTTPVLAQFVLDCSGSMAGSSIAQSKAALRAIVAQLDQHDRINVLRFGTHHEFMLRRPQALNPVIRQTILDAALTLRADLGGTELMPALFAALKDLARLPADLPGERILFIVSDGEVWHPEITQFLGECAAQQVRVFAVAVGNAAVESTFRPMVQATGGALERVVPGDDMAERIERHFQRVRQGALRQLKVRWPGTAQWEVLPDTLYPGDTAVLMAGGIRGSVANNAGAILSWIDPSGQVCSAALHLRDAGPELSQADAMRRMIAAQRLPRLDPTQACNWAVQYQLLTARTGLTIVKRRAAELGLDELPELRVVPQMLPAGWGGIGAEDVEELMPSPAGNRAPLRAPEHLLHPLSAAAVRALNQSRRLLKGSSPIAAHEHVGLQPDESAAILREQFLQVLLNRLNTDVFHVELIKTGQFTVEHFDPGALTVDLLNWLDAACEAVSLGLSDGAFWFALCKVLCPYSEALHSRLGVLPAHPLEPRLRDYLADAAPV